MEKHLFLTSQQLAVMLHLTGDKCVTGFQIGMRENTRGKRQLLFEMYREGIICNYGTGFEVSSEWKEAFNIMQKSDRVVWIAFAKSEQQDILIYTFGEKSVCVENLSDENHDRYRVFAEDTAVLKKCFASCGLFPRIRMEQKDCETLDAGLGVLPKVQPEWICSFALYRNGVSDCVERSTIEREQLVYYVRTEDADGTERRRASKGEAAHILERYICAEVFK